VAQSRFTRLAVLRPALWQILRGPRTGNSNLLHKRL
jgi:hypothetical protein